MSPNMTTPAHRYAFQILITATVVIILIKMSKNRSKILLTFIATKVVKID